jgi:hypothetical protein
MALRISTTGSNIQIDDLGLVINHPTSNRDLSLEFTPSELRDSIDLTNAIQNGDLAVDDGQFVINADDYDSNEVINQELELKLDRRFISHDELHAGKNDTPIVSGVFPLSLNSTASATRNVYIPSARWGTWQIDADDVVVITGSSAADGEYTVESVSDYQNFIVAESISNSTGGNVTVYHPAASNKIGVDNTNFTTVSGTDLQNVLEDIDYNLGLSTSSGINEITHRTLDHLVHNIAEDSYEELTYTSGKITNSTIWTDDTKTTKIREEQYVYTGNLITSMTAIQYNSGGNEFERVVETYTRTGSKITSIDREQTDA